MNYISRVMERAVARALARAPAVAILGPRQCGKSTLARQMLAGRPAVLLDLQRQSDLNKLADPELFFSRHRQELVCLDEIQRLTDIFGALRSEIDLGRRPGRFLILGSASRDLIRQSSESLAGRIAYLDLTPILAVEVAGTPLAELLWERGGFPESLGAPDAESSLDWRLDYIRTYLERDVPQLGFTMPAPQLNRLWLLFAHSHGQTLNQSKVAEAAGMNVRTLGRCLHLLEQSYMLRLLPPAETNLKKRLVKAPKVYIRDSGILHALLGIGDHDQLLGHPVNGSSWEGFCIENLLAAAPKWRPGFLRTGNGAELDLVLERGGAAHVYEFKLSTAPKPGRGFHELVADLRPTSATVVAPVDTAYEVQKGVRVMPLVDACRELTGMP
ncbi:MAG: ATP-binding protein [Lentisphaeria bacterium]